MKYGVCVWCVCVVCVCVYVRGSEGMVYVPDVSAQGVSSPLQGPGEKSQLPSETCLVEALRVGGQQGQVLGERAQCVLASAVQNMPERSLHRRHVLGQEVVFHLEHR